MRSSLLKLVLYLSNWVLILCIYILCWLEVKWWNLEIWKLGWRQKRTVKWPKFQLKITDYKKWNNCISRGKIRNSAVWDNIITDFKEMWNSCFVLFLIGNRSYIKLLFYFYFVYITLFQMFQLYWKRKWFRETLID